MNCELEMCDVYKNNMQVNEIGSAGVGKVGWLMVDAVVVELWGLKSGNDQKW